MKGFSASNSQQITIQNLQEFHQWVRHFKSHLKGNEILLLSGELGAGKTEFVKALAALYGISNVTSPTFALHRSLQSGKQIIDHFDLYRLENADELESTGFWEILQSPSLVVVEWPDQVAADYWPRDRTLIRIEIKKLSDSARQVCWR